MSEPKIEVYLELLEKALRETIATAEKVQAPHRLFQLKEGKATPLWLVGHLANTINVVLIYWTLNQPFALSKQFAQLFAPDFGGGMPPCADAEKYPPWEQVLEAYDQVMQKGMAHMRELKDAELPNPPKGKIPEVMLPRFPTIGAVLNQMVHHDAYHRGQLGLLSKLNP